jgi:hypothetical protein
VAQLEVERGCARSGSSASANALELPQLEAALGWPDAGALPDESPPSAMATPRRAGSVTRCSPLRPARVEPAPADWLAGVRPPAGSAECAARSRFTGGRRSRHPRRTRRERAGRASFAPDRADGVFARQRSWPEPEASWSAHGARRAAPRPHATRSQPSLDARQQQYHAESLARLQQPLSRPRAELPAVAGSGSRGKGHAAIAEELRAGGRGGAERAARRGSTSASARTVRLADGTRGREARQQAPLGGAARLARERGARRSARRRSRVAERLPRPARGVVATPRRSRCAGRAATRAAGPTRRRTREDD